jgi:hypothetical protein
MAAITDFAVMSPVLLWNAGDLELPGGVEAIRLSEDQRPDISADLYITQDQKQRLRACEYWLIRQLVERESHESIEESTNNLHNTQIAFQIILPRDSELIFLTNSRSKVYRALAPPRWSRMLWPREVEATEMTKVVEGVQAAFKVDSVRLRNPFYFLELGLQADNPGGRSFLWTTGIDSLLVANSEGKFTRRLSNLLGANSYVFPSDVSGRQPIYTVGNLAPRMYELRSLIAHGVEIDASFRRKVGFQATGGSFQLTGDFLNYLEADVLNEAALFVLCAILKRIVASDSMLDLFLMQDKWTNVLDTGAFPA